MTVVLMPDPRVAAIPVRECGERLADVRTQGDIRVDTRRHDPDGSFAHLRQGLLGSERRPARRGADRA
ncbi:hypothetical protein ACE1SV_70030 [Streptomyces sennicomposti]